MSMAGPRRKRSPGAGNARELRVMDVLHSEGWLCASRRHIGGAGDILAVREFQAHADINGNVVPELNTFKQVKLIEVKSTSYGPWDRFGPDDRQALVETAERHGCEAWLYWWRPRGDLIRLHSSEFPADRRRKAEVEE